jgi:hypothetical protein
MDSLEAKQRARERGRVSRYCKACQYYRNVFLHTLAVAKTQSLSLSLSQCTYVTLFDNKNEMKCVKGGTKRVQKTVKTRSQESSMHTNVNTLTYTKARARDVYCNAFESAGGGNFSQSLSR